MAKFTKDELHGLLSIADTAKAKDADVDVKHVADYLWTWEKDNATIARQIMNEEYHKAAKAGAKNREEAIKIAYEKAKIELAKVYKALQAEVDKKLKNGYAVQLRELEAQKKS